MRGHQQRCMLVAMPPGGGAWWRPSRPVRLPPHGTPVVLIATGAVAFLSAALLVHTGATRLDKRLFSFINDVPSWASSILTPLSKVFLPAGLVVVIAVAAVYVTIR